MANPTPKNTEDFAPIDASPYAAEPASAGKSETEIRARKSFYLPVKAKFVIATGFATLWFLISVFLARPWLEELSAVTGPLPAILIIFFIALFPGFLNAHIVASIILDSPPPLSLDIKYPPVTILMAAYNEAANVRETFRSIAGQDYPALVQVIVVDDGSTDGTVEILSSLKLPNLNILRAHHGGKARALNRGLKDVTNEIVVTIDADTFFTLRRLSELSRGCCQTLAAQPLLLDACSSRIPGKVLWRVCRNGIILPESPRLKGSNLSIRGLWLRKGLSARFAPKLFEKFEAGRP